MWSGWLCLGGNEVGNTARSIGYSQSADCAVDWLIDRDCGGTADALGDPAYEIHDIESAPWYDPRDPATSRFYGLYMLGAKGLADSTRSGSYTEGIVDGGVPGDVRYTGKTIRYRAWMTAMGEDALEAGMSWLNAALAPTSCGMHGAACGATDLSFFVSCPPERRIIPDYSPWAEKFRNLFTNPSFETEDGTVDIYRNLFTNPELTGSGTVELWRNLIPNPEFTAGSGTVEVRRNLVPQPILSDSASMWESVSGATITPSAGGAILDQAIAPTGTWAFRMSGANGPLVTAGVTYSVEVAVQNIGTAPASLALLMQGVAGSATQTTVQAAGAALAPGETRVLGGLWTAPSGMTRATPLLHTSGGVWGAGSKLLIRDGVNFEASPVRVSGWVPTAPDPDLTASWTGPVNASASILTGVPVSGVSTNQCIAIRSSKFGGSLRLIATSATDNNSYAEISPAPALIAQQTLLATVNLEAPLTGSLHASRLRLQSATPLVDGGAPPNAAGSYPQRVVANPSSQGRMLFRHGGLVGSGDVYWTKPALVPGNYSGPFFSGASPLADPDLVTSWTGAPNASASIVTGVPVTAGLPGMAADSARTLVSSEFPGAVRVIPTGTTESRLRLSGYNLASFQAGKTYTVLATLRLPAAQTGSLATNARSITAAWSGGTIDFVAAPNTPGVHTLRLTFTVPAAAAWATVLLTNGAAQGGGDVLWEDIVVIAGAYDGPFFSGANPHPDPDFTTIWAGTEGASESVVTGVAAAGVTVLTGVAVLSTRWAKEGSRSLRLITIDGNGVLAVMPAPVGQHTALVTAHLEAPMPSVVSIFPSLTNGTETAMVPNVAGDHDLRITGERNAGSSGFFLTGGITAGDSVWYDCAGIFAGSYTEPWFDGNTEDAELERYSWDGEEGNSTSRVDTRFHIERMQTDEEYDEDIVPLIRRLHNVITISGPLEIETRRSRDGKHWGRLVEFTLYAGMPWTFSETKELQLSLPTATVVQDTPFNLVTVPSAELAGSAVVAATNYTTNPSLEVNDAGWYAQTALISGSSTYTASEGRVVGELAAAGTASMRARLLGGASSGSGRALHRILMTTNISTRPAGAAVSVTVWGAMVNVGAATGTTLRSMEAVLRWYPSGGGSPISETVFGRSTDPATFGGRVFSLSSVTPPAGAAIAEVEVRGEFDWSSGTNKSDVRLYVDALGVTVP